MEMGFRGRFMGRLLQVLEGLFLGLGMGRLKYSGGLRDVYPDDQVLTGFSFSVIDFLDRITSKPLPYPSLSLDQIYRRDERMSRSN